MSKVNYPEHLNVINGLQNVSTAGKLRFYMAATHMRNIRLQHHDYVEFAYFESVNGIQTINGVRHELKPGTVSFILPHQMHSIESPTDRQSRKYCCMFDLQLLFGTHDDSELYSLVYGIGRRMPSFVDFQGPERERMHRLFLELLQEYRQSGSPGNFHMIRAKLTEMLLLFVRTGTEPVRGDLPMENKWNWFWQMLHYVHTHYSDSLTQEELSRTFHVSPTHLSRTFKEQTGQGFLDYLHRIRIDSACSMLVHTNMSISAIGIDVGFESFRTFSRVFREIKGVTARQYRKDNAAKQAETPMVL